MILFKGRKGTKFKKPLIILASVFIGFFALLYLTFLMAPFFIDINSYTPLIKDELKKYTKLDFVLENPKLQTTFDLALKLSADKIAFKYEDGKDFAALNKPFVKINLPTLLIKHLNLDKIYVSKAEVFVIFNNNKYTIFDYFIEQKKDETNEETEVQPLPIDINNIKIVADEAVFKLLDKNVSKTYVLEAKDNLIRMASLEGPLTLKTKGNLKLEEGRTFVDFDLNLVIPFVKSDNAGQNQTQEFQMITFNPLNNLDKTNFYSNIKGDLKISDIENFSAKGEFNLSDITMLIDTVQLPKSFLNTTFDGNKISSDAQFFITQDEFLKINSKINTGKNFNLSVNCKTDTISLDNLRKVMAAFLNIFGIENDLKNAKAQGYLTSDFNISTNLKKITSSGKSELKGGGFQYSKANLNVTNIVSLIDFSNNKITIKDTSALLNGAKFSITGDILTNSLNLNINSDPIKISDVVKLGQELKVIKASDIKDYDFQGGIIKLAVKLSGKLDNIIPDANISAENLAIKIKSLGLPFKIQLVKMKVKPKGKDFDMDIDVSNVTCSATSPKFNLKIPSMKIKADSKLMEISQTQGYMDNSDFLLKGKINNYLESAINFNFDITGKLAPTSVLQLLDSNSRKFVKSQGKVPFDLNVSGNFSDIKIKTNLMADSANYISIADITSNKGAKSLVFADINLMNDILNINSISLTSGGVKIADVKGKLSSIYAKNPNINTLHISIPQKTSFKVAVLGNLSCTTSGNLNISGSVLAPLVLGSVQVWDLVYPEFNLKSSYIKGDFKKSSMDFSTSSITLGKSDFAGNASVSTNFTKDINLNSLNFTSNYMDTDELIKITSSMPNTQTTPGPSVKGFNINKGTGIIKKAKSGTLYAQDISFDFTLKNNLVKLTKFIMTAYDGRITGTIDYNIAQLRSTVNLLINDMNVKKFAHDMTQVVVPITGTASGIANLTLKGANLTQQLQSLSGTAKFDVKRGEMTDFASFQNFLQADNLTSNSLVKSTLKGVVNSVASKGISTFETLEGTINFSNGWANLQTFKTKGSAMSVNVEGKYNMLTNYADLKILGRASSSAVGLLGSLGNYSAGNLVNKAVNANDTLATIAAVVAVVAPTNPFFEVTTNAEVAKVPDLSGGNANSRMFKVIIKGLASKATSVKTFKWVDATVN